MQASALGLVGPERRRAFGRSLQEGHTRRDIQRLAAILAGPESTTIRLT